MNESKSKQKQTNATKKPFSTRRNNEVWIIYTSMFIRANL